MGKNTSLDRPREGRGEVVATKSTDTLVTTDDGFAQRLERRERSLIRRWFPDSAEKKVAEYETRMLGLASDAKVEGYRMYLEFQRQAIKEALDGFLQQGKVKSRKDQTEFFEYHARDLQQKVNNSTAEYFADMERRLTAIDTSNHRVSLRQREERMLETRMDEFENNITFLMGRFASIPEEGV